MEINQVQSISVRKQASSTLHYPFDFLIVWIGGKRDASTVVDMGTSIVQSVYSALCFN